MENVTQRSRTRTCEVCGQRRMKADFSRRRLTCGSSALAALLIFLICFSYSVPAEAQGGDWDIMASHRKEYQSTDVPKDIPGRGMEISTLTITDTGPIVDLNVKLNITHPYDADLDVFLIAPDGTRVELFTDVGVVSADFEDTVLDDEASESITDGRGPFTGSFRPEGNLADVYGNEIEGTWTLEVTDDWSSSRAGTLNAWSLIVTIELSAPLPAPVIQANASAAGGILDIVSWEDIGEISQYDSDIPEAIPDQGTLLSELVVDHAGAIQDLDVMLDIDHTMDSDLDVFLIAPDSQIGVELFTDVGGSGDNFEDTILDDEARLSITAGSAPFAGTYRPEGRLADLIGRNICGTWGLKVTDDSKTSLGTLNAWSLIVDLADVAYYAECARDVDFSHVVSNSGWITSTSYRFTGLTPTQAYWYRVKARPLETWFQTSEEQFNTDTMTGTQTTDGDFVTLEKSAGSELNVIAHPSFESLDGWFGGATNSNIILGGIRDLWTTKGRWAGMVGFSSDGYYYSNDFGFLVQPIDLTEVDTLVFDWASWGFANLLEAAVFVGDTRVWFRQGTDATMYPDFISANRDESVDLTAFKGEQDLGLVVYSNMTGRFDAAILWDNLRTYGSRGYKPTGRIVSTQISIGEDDTWGALSFEATIPNRTTLTVDILPAEGTNPIPGYTRLASGADLSRLVERTIRLRANLSTTDQSATPILYDWSVTYSDAVGQSPWSDVASSPVQPGGGSIIVSVVRANGERDNRAPIGEYDGYTSVLPTQPGGLKNGNLCFSDRTYSWAKTPASLAGAEYVRTFNSDKKSSTVTYTLTTSREATLMITVDQRIVNRQQAANQATARFARVGTFVDSGLTLFIQEDAMTSRSQSVFSARFPAGTYVFSAMPTERNMYVIAAME
ncbi:MAG: proprotein convertase P-domain-containing protein [Sedimentisphaerales bacterium]|nr:proprotein convertase P-domain-containing protein [Sedimentisphaerales bacterium]